MQRYARQMILPELGEEGQKLLKEKTVLCVGAGGLGAPALLYLAAAGMGRIQIVDDDVVDASNLQRQVLFREQDQGQIKAIAAKRALEALNSEIKIESFPQRFMAENAKAFLSSCDVVIDGTDNFVSKFLINDACVKFCKPLIYASILGFEAQVAVFYAEHGPCYRCLFPQVPAGHIPNCAEAGVIGALAGIAGSMQALEAIKMALGISWCKAHELSPLTGRLWLCDARSMETRTLALPKDPACPVCSKPRASIVLAEEGHACPANVESLPASKVRALLGEAIFIDVREEQELLSGMIPGALHIPLPQLLSKRSRLNQLPTDKQIIVYCQHGVRSLRAVAHLHEIGFIKAAQLRGGIAQWQDVLGQVQKTA